MPKKSLIASLQEGFNKKAALSTFKIAKPPESLSEPTTIQLWSIFRNEDYRFSC